MRIFAAAYSIVPAFTLSFAIIVVSCAYYICVVYFLACVRNNLFFIFFVFQTARTSVYFFPFSVRTKLYFLSILFITARTQCIFDLLNTRFTVKLRYAFMHTLTE